MTENRFLPFPLKAVAFDLDDTLLHDDLTISDRTVALCRHLRDQGVHILPVSGRAKMSIRPFVDRLDCASLYITCNGAEVWDAGTHVRLHQETFSTALGREVARFAREHRCYAQTYSEDRFFYSEESIWADRYKASSMLPGTYVGDLEAFIQEPRTKILLMSDEATIRSMLLEARELFAGRLSVTCSKPVYLEFNPLAATKGNALRLAAELLHISLAHLMAFGDGLNDMTMLQAAGWPVAVSNATPELKAAARDICLSNVEDGVAQFLLDRIAAREVVL